MQGLARFPSGILNCLKNSETECESDGPICMPSQLTIPLFRDAALRMSDSDSDVTDNAEPLFDHRQAAMRTYIGKRLTSENFDDKLLANIFIFWREEWARHLLT
ncbi:9238_t:CDS:1, partial [Acaulospora colombiana]